MCLSKGERLLTEFPRQLVILIDDGFGKLVAIAKPLSFGKAELHFGCRLVAEMSVFSGGVLY